MEKDGETRMVLQPHGLSKESYGLFLVFIFALCYGLMGTFIQLSVSTGLSSTELGFIRSIFQGIIVVTSMCFIRTELSSDSDEAVFDYHNENDGPDKASETVRLIQIPMGQRKVLPIVLARGVIGGVGLLLYFFTMASIPLGDATSVLALSPVITVVASSIFLGEELTYSALVAAVSTVIGAVLISKPVIIFGSTNEENDAIRNPLGYVSGICGSCTASAVVMLVRAAGTTGGVHTLQLLFSWCLFGSLYALLVLFLPGTAPLEWPSSPQATTYVLFMCIFGVLGHFCMNYGGQFAPAGLSSIVRASLVLWGYCFEALVFRQIPDHLTAMGALLIITSVSIVAWQKYQAKQRKEQGDELVTIQTNPAVEMASTNAKNSNGQMA